MKEFVKKSVLGLCMLYVITTSIASGASIGLNIQGGGNAAEGTVATASNLGVTGLYQQINWNSLMGSQHSDPSGVLGTFTGPFVDNSGQNTPLQITWTGNSSVNNWTNGHGGDPLDPAPADSGIRTGTTAAPGNLFTGYAYTNGQPESFRLSGIPYATYDLVFMLVKERRKWRLLPGLPPSTRMACPPMGHQLAWGLPRESTWQTGHWRRLQDPRERRLAVTIS